MGKRYVFSYISFFDNELISEIVESDLSIVDVAIEQLRVHGYALSSEDKESLETLKNLAFDADLMFEIIEV